MNAQTTARLGTLPVAFPATVAALHRVAEQVVAPAREPDMAELTIAVNHGMNITHVLLDNGQLGKISKEQAAGEWDVWQTSLHNPDFSAYARNCGALGIHVTNRAALDAALAEAVTHDGPAMGEVITDPNLVLGAS